MVIKGQTAGKTQIINVNAPNKRGPELKEVSVLTSAGDFNSSSVYLTPQVIIHV